MYTAESPISQSLHPLLHAYIIDSNQVVLKFFQAVSSINGQKIRQYSTRFYDFGVYQIGEV
jgi:hypothetical protein